MSITLGSLRVGFAGLFSDKTEGTQLYEWISDGFPGSRMPAFRSTLSDTDRWNLVDFSRTMAPKQ